MCNRHEFFFVKKKENKNGKNEYIKIVYFYPFTHSEQKQGDNWKRRKAKKRYIYILTSTRR